MQYELGTMKAEMNSLRNQFLNTAERGKALFIIVDETGCIDYISKYVEDILHFTQHDLIGSSLFEIVEPDSISKLKKLLQAGSQQIDQSLSFQDIGLHCTYCLRHFFDGILLAKNTNVGKRYVLYLHDVTERKTEAEKLAKVNLELDSFIYKASHDLRAPLLSLSGLINLTERGNTDEIMEYVHLMRKSVGRLDKYITQLAHYARNTNLGVEYTRLDFKEIFEDVIENYKFLPNAEKIDFIIEVDSSCSVCSDSFRLKIILNNLVSNAIKYHNLQQHKPFIKLTASVKAQSFSISVIDNGIGITPVDIDSIFDMFKRATDKGDGSGLGLYIVSKALDKIGGKIAVTSSVNVGTAFTLEIPYDINQCTFEMEPEKKSSLLEVA
jgi:signal transduction histidine kinase